MLIVEEKTFMWQTKEIHFSARPYDISECDGLIFHLCQDKVDAKGFARETKFTSVIDLTQSLDAIWGNMSKKSCRYAIKRAERDGVKAKLNQNYEEFYEIFGSLAKKKGIGPFLWLQTVKPRAATISRYGTLFIAEYDGEILGGHVYLKDDNYIRLWLSASKRLETDKDKATLIGNANRQLHWEAIKYAREKGIKEFDMGGLFPDEVANRDAAKRAINFFKMSFGGETATRYTYQKVYSKSYKLAKYAYHLAAKWRG